MPLGTPTFSLLNLFTNLFVANKNVANAFVVISTRETFLPTIFWESKNFSLFVLFRYTRCEPIIHLRGYPFEKIPQS
jgi:hypothetical protein